VDEANAAQEAVRARGRRGLVEALFGSRCAGSVRAEIARLILSVGRLDCPSDMARVPFDPATDYYKLLGVGPSASVEEIQAAYRRLAKAFHPDLNAGSAVAASRMAGLNVAKSVLLDRDTRAIYDQLRAERTPAARIAAAAARPAAYSPVDQVSVRYAPYEYARRPRYRVVSSASARSVPRASFDRGTGILLLIALPLLAALVLYVFQAVQLSIQPLKIPSPDVALAPGTTNHPTARGAADGVFQMIHAQPPSSELATRANNFILARSDSTPESELLRADGRRLIHAATTGDFAAWEAAVADVCQLAGRC
jgi:curved DNA-binding protein CbpA